jgi:hypothetical protein
VSYQAACIYALTSRQDPGDRSAALRLLAAALRRKPGWLRVIPQDPDLDPIRNLAEFRELVRAAAVVGREEPRGQSSSGAR